MAYSAVNSTIQTLPDARKYPNGQSPLFMITEPRRGVLSPWGTRERERELRAYYRHPYNTLVQGAFQGLIKKIKGTPWEITGGKTRTSYFSNVLREAQFGRGWGDFLSRVLLDYLRQDVGAFVEVIAPGNPKRAPTGRIVGLAHLDAMRCYLTGDPEYPVLYYAQDGKTHLLHHTRVLHLVDMPDGDEDYRDYGLCALSRAIAVVERQLYMANYIRTKLDDVPPPGIMVASNISDARWEEALQRFINRTTTDTRDPLGRTMIVFGLNPQENAELKVTNFSEPPEGFDYEKYMGIDVNMLAVALGVDRQEIWELTGANIGSQRQSEILHAKSQGKAYGDILTSLERAMNRLMPPDIDFNWKIRDHEEQRNNAEIAGLWTTAVRQLDGLIMPDLQVRILANQVSAVSDAVIDSEGNLIRVNDVDPDATPDEGVPTPVTQNTQNDVTNRTPGSTGTVGAKSIAATRLDFEDAFEDVLANARKGVYKPVRLRSILLNLIRQYGEKAYLDGKQEGGVDEPLSDSEEAEMLSLLASQREYVQNFVARVTDTGISDTEAEIKPAMWYTKSIAPFRDAGRLSADKNGMYEFGGTDGAESCETCRTLKGQRHRMKDWTRARLRPGVDTENFICRGFQCKHTLSKAEGRSRGRLPTVKEMAHA